MEAKPTAAQVAYLENACGEGRHFLIHEPGNQQAGLACARRGWIKLLRYPSVYYIRTPAGRAVLETAENDEHAQKGKP